MGISSSLNAGVSGLNANANKLATISDNIANSQTYGYKRADVDFSSIAISDSKSPNTVGGGRWFNAGGVRTAAIWDVDAKGRSLDLERHRHRHHRARLSAGDLDLGGLVGQDRRRPAVHADSTGSFKTDKDGYLTTNSGLTLLGWPADNNGKVAQQPRDTSNGLVPVHINTSAVAMEPTANIGLNVNLPTDDVTAGASGEARTVTIQYYDNVGAAQTLAVTLTPTVPATGPQQRVDDGGHRQRQRDLARHRHADLQRCAAERGRPRELHRRPRRQLGFRDRQPRPRPRRRPDHHDGDGLDRPDGRQPPDPDRLDLLVLGRQPRRQCRGHLHRLSIDANGYLSATYSTGFSKVLYQVPVADVPNPDGLTVLDNQCFALSPSSGNMFLWDAGTGPVGAPRASPARPRPPTSPTSSPS